MRRFNLVIVALLVGALMLVAAGCGGSDPDAAKTPANAPTITNGQDAPAGGGETGGEAEDPAGVAGKTFFEGPCQGCHPAGGTEQGAGPVLAGKGLTEDAIKNQIVNGGGAMPPGLAAGEDLENVTKFVLSIQ